VIHREIQIGKISNNREFFETLENDFYKKFSRVYDSFLDCRK
jgi:hypothetical protein